MLEELRIASLGVIEEATLEFSPGLNVVTGETGAGKTMVVTALGLLLGARADPRAVRHGAARCLVEGRLAVEAALAERAEEAGALVEDGALIVGRGVSAEGRSRATAGGATVPAGVLGSLTCECVVIHGQAEQQRLLLPVRQRDYLDAYGGDRLAPVLEAYRSTYQRLGEVRRTLDEIVHQARQRAQEADLLSIGLEEVRAAAPTPGEDLALREEESRLAHADGLLRAAQTARQGLAGDESALAGTDALSLVAAARKALDDERDHDPALAALAEALAGASYALADVATDLASYAANLDVDPARLAAVSQRRAVLGALTRKYGDTVDDVLAWAQQAQARLHDLTLDESRTGELSDERDRLEGALADLGGRLTSLRRDAARDLGRAVTAELAELAMAPAVFAVVVRPLGQPGPRGADDVVFTLAASRGAPAMPIARSASGGELSRLMLALEVCLAGSAPPSTMVFDEVDAGVGGRAAVEIGRRLARLARSSQVIVVTHLPQVAAFADRHHVVVKSSDGSVTTSGVTAVDDAGRLRELARMLAGLEDSQTALAHATELVELADADRATG